jgi:mono/diheme cytochrome c family protein
LASGEGSSDIEGFADMNRNWLNLASFPAGALLCACATLLAIGCGRADPPQFVLNLEGREADLFRVTAEDTSAETPEAVESNKEGKAANRQSLNDIATALVGLFGTPDEPYIPAETGLDLKKIRRAAGPVHSNVSEQRIGKQWGLYRQHCVHCHGITGDGAGPTAAFLNPYPRDYRKGLFKFKSTELSAKPTDEDLHQIMMDGVPGTAMPSFALLAPDEIDALVEYVKYLAIRGETEILLLDYTLDQGEELELDREFLLSDFVVPVVETWTAAEEAVITPPERPDVSDPAALAASIDAGYKLFNGKADCKKCHGPTGLGDGGGDKLYDDWNKDKVVKADAYWALTVQELKPRNLRLGNYRGGRRPLDIYRRVHAGIRGTPMPGAGPSGGNAATLTPEQIWQLVDYVRSLPYEELSQSNETLATVQKDRN